MRQRVEKIAKTVYGADGVDWSPEATAKAEIFENDPAYDEYSTMMVKTQLSLTHIPEQKGVPKRMETADTGYPTLFRRQISLSLRRRDQPDAGYRLRPFFSGMWM